MWAVNVARRPSSDERAVNVGRQPGLLSDERARELFFALIFLLGHFRGGVTAEIKLTNCKESG